MNPMRGNRCCSAENKPTDIVVFPSSIRVAATKMRGVIVLRKTSSGRFTAGSRKTELAMVDVRDESHYASFRKE
jgi:hypothetical protein